MPKKESTTKKEAKKPSPPPQNPPAPPRQKQKQKRQKQSINNSAVYRTESAHHIKLASAVLGSVNFAVQDISFNAGNSTLFPRLAQIARTYQYYRFTKWHIEYEPIASVFGNGQSGQVNISLLQNWYDPIPDNMTAQTERSRACMGGPAWKGFKLNLPATGWKYVRDAPSAQGQDMRLDDEIIEVGTEGFVAGAAGVAVGYLYVTADVEFKTPYTVSLLSPPRTNTIQVFNTTADYSLTSSPAGLQNALVWNTGGSPASLTYSAYTGCTYTVGTDGSQFTLQGGTYRIDVNATVFCTGAGAIILQLYPSAGYSQLMQLDTTSFGAGAILNFLASTDTVARMSAVITVPEGAPITFSIWAVCVQAASAPIQIRSEQLICTPC